MGLKADADAIRKVLAARTQTLQLGPRQWWLDYAFHFTDVQNAVGILTEEKLLSRGEAVARSLMKVENADREIIHRSAHRTANFARLYFRPRTPTQWNNEGCRPEGHRPRNAHCPVPIFFLFDLATVLIQEGVLFSNGQAASPSVVLGGGAAALRNMNWKDIYSSGSMGTDPSRIGDLKFYRMAEILVPDELGLDALSHVVCRTGPERTTLLSLLSPEARAKWRSKIRLNGRAELYEGHWTYVQDVTWTADTVVIMFNPSWEPAPFKVRATITNPSDNRSFEYATDRSFQAGNNRLRLKIPVAMETAHVTVWLDRCLVYDAELQCQDLLL